MKTHAISLPLAFLFVFFSLAFLFLPKEVNAAVLYSQPDYSTTINRPTSGTRIWDVQTEIFQGTHPSMSISRMYIAFPTADLGGACGFYTANVGGAANWDIKPTSAGGQTGGAFSAHGTTCTEIIDGATSIYQLDFSSPIAISANTSYNVYLGQWATVKGVAADVAGGYLTFPDPYNSDSVGQTSYGDAFLVLCDSACSIPEPVTDFSTRIEWVNPPITTPSATTSSSTIDFEFNYYLNSNDSDLDTFTHILLQLYPLSYPNDPAQRITVETPLIADSYENVVVTVTTNKLGYYMGMVSFWNGVEETTECNWWDIFNDCTEEHPVVGATFSNKFNIATTTIPADAPPFIVQGMDSICNGIDSDFFGIDTLMCKTISFLFMPSANTFTEIQLSMNEAFRNNLPFSTFYQFNAKVTSIAHTDEEAGTDVVLHNVLGLDTVEIFNYANARGAVGSLFPSGIGDIIVWCEWIFFTILGMFIVTRPKQS